MTAKRFLPFFGLAAFAAAAYLVYRAVRRYDPAEIVASILAVSVPQLLLGLLFVAGSYFSLTLFDTLAVRYVGAKVPYRRIALASFTALSIGHTVGFAAASSATIRYRFYSRWGVSTGDIARIILFCAMTVGLGLNTLAGIALLLRPAIAVDLIGFSETFALMLGTACLAVTTVYLGFAMLLGGTLTIWQWEISMPPPKLALAQICVGTINFCFVAAALHQVLLANIEVTYIAVATIYVLGNLASLLSHVPGGLGVLEAVVMYLLPQAAVVGALLAFRGLYFFLPFVIGVTVFATYELRQRRLRPELKGEAASMVQE